MKFELTAVALFSASGASAWGWGSPWNFPWDPLPSYTPSPVFGFPPWPTAFPVWPQPSAYSSVVTSVCPTSSTTSAKTTVPSSTFKTSTVVSSKTPSSTSVVKPSTTSVKPSSSTSSPAPSSSSKAASSSSSSSIVLSSSAVSSSVEPTTTSVATSSVAVSTAPAGPCPTGVHIIAARGSLEDQGEGLIGSLANNITARIPGSDSEALTYPAVLFPYQDSEHQGIGNLTELLMSYNARCPKTKIVLIGWSQGGQVILDTLCGNSETNFPQTAPISQTYTQMITAAIAYGDPSFHLNQPYNVGSATRDGIFNRTDLAACSPYYQRLQSYCDDNDLYCTNSQNNSGLADHFAYFDKYNQAATNFVVLKST